MLAYFILISSMIMGIVITFVHGETVPCGKPFNEPDIQPITRRIVGGQEAKPGSWPWMVMLKENGSHVCGGSILNEKFILTAAHCFRGNHSSNPSHWQVYAGKHHKLQNDPTETLHHVKKIIPHPEFNKTSFVHDLALVELQEPIVYNLNVSPVCMPRFDPLDNPKKLCYAIGWGDTRGTGNDNILNQVKLPIILHMMCAWTHWYGKKFVQDETFCAGYSSGAGDGCSGDSGGPLNCKVNDEWYVQGVQSWGVDCAQPYRPGIYTNVFWHTNSNWIKKILSAGSTDQ